MRGAKFVLIVLMLVTLSCSLVRFSSMGPTRVVGSGVLASEERPESDFTAVELDGSAIVTISFGDTEKVVVEADDNILPLVETDVRGGTLVIGFQRNTNFDTDLGIHVTITMKSLEAATINGSGNIKISDLAADQLRFNIPGSGVITATGTAAHLDASVDGSGNIVCDELEANSVRVEVNGSGNVMVFARESLQAEINGSGSVVYSGDPSYLQTSINGSGSINPAP